MADVLIVCVREDEPRAKALADMFEAAGFSIGGAPGNDAALRSSGAGVVVWSQASIRSRPFLDAAQRVINANKAVVASLIEPPPPESVGNAPAFDLSRWTGDPDDPGLDPLFFAVDRMVNSARAAVGAPAAEPPAPAFQPPPSLRPAPPPQQPPQRAAPLPPRPAPRPLPPPPQPQLQPQPPAADPLGSEAEHWRAIRNSRDPAAFLDYLSRYGAEGAFADVAELRLKQLTEGAPAPAPARMEPPPQRRPAVAPDPLPPLRPEPPAPRRETARRDPPPPPAYEPRFEPDERPKAGGGGLRALILILLLGGGALAGGLYFGGNLDAVPPQRAATEAPASDAATADAPTGGDVETGAVRESAAFSDVASSAPAPRRDPPPQAQRQREEPPPRQVAASQPPPQSAPPPASGPASLSPPPTTATGAGPVSLNPGAAAQPAPAGGLDPAGAAFSPPPQTAAPVPAAATPPPQPARAGTVRFAQRPSARRISDAYPSRAMRDGVGGRVELDCTVLAGLALTCSVASETPARMGFGQAALTAAGSYRAQPTLSDGASAVGARTRIVVQFQAPAQ